MTFTLVASLGALLCVLVAAWVIFIEYPRSAIDSTRNTLFSLRDDLFELAKSNTLSFESEAYQFSREMLNALIRYAHDISATQLFVAVLLQRNEASKRYKLAAMEHWRLSMGSLQPVARDEVNRIMDHALASMFQLVVVRSPTLSVVLSGFLFVHTLRDVLAQTRKSLSVATTNVKVRLAVRKTTPDVHLSNVEETIVEILENKPMRRVRPVISAEASRYLPARLDPMEFCAAA